MRIAIIGAGMAGLRCGLRLTSAGHLVRLFDKGRGPGGRMATRRMTIPGGERQAAFDHGAQYMSAKGEAFAAQLAEWEAAELVARWPAAGDAAFVGLPGMNAPLKAMAAQLDVAWGVEITGVTASGLGWRLSPIEEEFDTLVVAVPPEQAARLLAPVEPVTLSLLAARVESSACWTVMAAFDERLASQADVIREVGPIGWAARNSAKPGRTSIDHGGLETWVVQAGPDWSAAHLEDAPEAVSAALLQALGQTLGALPAPLAVTAHRWRYAQSPGTGDGARWLPEQRLGVCGDWLVGPRVEAAWTSGDLLAAMVG